MSLRTIANNIFDRTLAAIEVGAVVHQAVQRNGDHLKVCDLEVDLQPFTQVIVVAVGKASVPMACAAAQILSEYITAGIIATNELNSVTPANFNVFIGGHPVPNQSSVDAARATLQLLRAMNDEQTLILFLLSGGGSALFEMPIADSITLDDLQIINRVLVGCGAVIGEMNVVRRFLSAVKGGRLAEAAPQARQISLYISDVNSDDLSTVSSGLTLPSQTTRADFDRIVEKYDLLKKFPPHVTALITSDALPDLPPTTANDLRVHRLLLDNREALRIAKQIAEQEYNCIVEIAEDLVEGEVEVMAQEHLKRLQIMREKHPDQRVCLLSGGEVICPVRGDGHGGRNQEFVLRTAMNNPQKPVAILSAGTDGIDGHSPAAGAVADENTLPRAAALGLLPADYLQHSDSFTFFHTLGDAILIGPTGNNVRDLRILLAA
jgi:glycerate 2-kinase